MQVGTSVLLFGQCLAVTLICTSYKLRRGAGPGYEALRCQLTASLPVNLLGEYQAPANSIVFPAARAR
jgi:hypothetical protein